MPKRIFDKKFGAAFLEGIPSTPGVYLFWTEEGRLLYVGKAKNLRRRLGEYRRAGRGHKGYRLVTKAASVTWEVCGTDLEAYLKEVDLIQSRKPTQNVASAYSFLYPFLGMKRVEHTWWFCYSTRPEQLPDYAFFGAFRSRGDTLEFFSSLVAVLKYLGHVEKGRRAFPPYTFGHAIRRLPEPLVQELGAFLRGESESFLSSLFDRLLNHAGARARAAEVKADLKILRGFFEQEARPLAEAIRRTAFGAYPVPQKERDPLFLRARYETGVSPMGPERADHEEFPG